MLVSEPKQDEGDEALKKKIIELEKKLVSFFVLSFICFNVYCNKYNFKSNLCI